MCHFQGGGGTSRGKRKKKKKKIKSTGFSQFSTVLSTSTVPVQSTFSRGNRATTPGESSFLMKTTDRSRAERWYQHRLARRSRQRSARKAARVLASRTEEAKSTGGPARTPDRVSHRRSKEARVARRRRQRRRQLYEQIRQKTVAKLLQFVNLQGGTDYDEATSKIPADWQPTTCRDMDLKKGLPIGSTEEHLPVTCTAVQSSTAAGSPKRELEDGLLLYVPIRIYGKEARALLDSGASRNFISPKAVIRLGVFTTHENSVLELADGKKILSQGKAPGVLVSVAGDTGKYDLTVCPLLKDVDVILGMTWLSKANPLIDWGTPRLVFPREQTTTAIVGTWADQSQQICQIRALDSFDLPPSRLLLPGSGVSAVLASPSFWSYSSSALAWTRRSRAGGHGAASDDKSEDKTEPVQDKNTQIRTVVRVQGQPHIKKQTKASKSRQLLTAKCMEKISKRGEQVYLAVVRGIPDQTGSSTQERQKRHRGRLCNIKLSSEGPKRDFISVEERREEVVKQVEEQYQQQLREILTTYQDVFPEKLPAGRPPKRPVELDIREEPGSMSQTRPQYGLGLRATGCPMAGLCCWISFFYF